MSRELQHAHAQIAAARRLQAAVGAMLAAQSVDELDRCIVDVLPGAVGFERVALLRPPAAREPARLVHALGYPALDLNGIPAASPLAAGAMVEAIRSGYEDDDPLPVEGVRGAYVLAPLRERGRVALLLYADTLREDVEPADAAAGVGYALDIAGLVRANLALVAERDRLVGELDALARTDSLTGLPNRRIFEERLEEELYRSARARRNFALAIVDVDRFKSINDEHGHQAGDRALQAFATVLRAFARVHDTVARFAGDEFAMILVDVDAERAKSILERMLTGIRDVRLPGIGLTASVGATLSYPVDSSETVIQRADAALYEAKRSGRDRLAFE